MKKIVFLTLIFMLIASAGFAAAAEPQDDVEIFIDGKKIDMPVPPRIQDGRTLVPARFIFEPLGAEVGWDDENRIASGTLEGVQVDIPIGSTEATIDGEVEELDVEAQIFNGRTYVPLRFSGEAFGRSVEWIDETRTIRVDEMGLLYTDDRWEEISNVAFSPDGDTIAVGARELDLYSASQREVLASGADMDYGDRPESRSLEFSPDGTVLAAAWTGASFHDAQDLTKLADFHGGGEARVAYSPDGEMMASHRTQMSGELLLWEKVNDVEFEKIAEFFPDDGMIHDIEFTPDGALIAGGFRDGIVHLWDTETFDLAGTIDFDSWGGNYNLTFSPDGTILAASDPDLASEFYLFDMEDFSRVDVFEPEGRVNRMQFSPDGSKLAYGLHGGGVEILCTEDWSLIYSFEQEDTVEGLSFAPDGKTMAVGSGGNLYVYGYQ